MGKYYKIDPQNKVKLGGVDIPCPCDVKVHGGGKIITTQNGVKRQTGWNDFKVTITGRLISTDNLSLNKQIKLIRDLAKKLESLSMVSIETENHDIKKVIIENHYISTVEGIDSARDMRIECVEDKSKTSTPSFLSESIGGIVKVINGIKKANKYSKLILKKGDDFAKIAADVFGDHTLEKEFLKINKDMGAHPLLSILQGKTSSKEEVDELNKYVNKAVKGFEGVTEILGFAKDTLGLEENKVTELKKILKAIQDGDMKKAKDLGNTGKTAKIPIIPKKDKEYVVKKGDTYFSIANAYYNDTRHAKKIRKANNYIKLIEGIIITLPALAKNKEI